MREPTAGSALRRAIIALMAGALPAFSSAVHAFPEPGTYQGTVSGQYFTGDCSPPGMDTAGNVPFSGATATLVVPSGSDDVTLDIVLSSTFALDGDGFVTSDDAALELFFFPAQDGNLNITAQETGNALSGFFAMPNISGDSNTVNIEAASMSGATEHCGTVFFDWNTFTVTRVGDDMVVDGDDDMVIDGDEEEEAPAGSDVTVEQSQVVAMRQVHGSVETNGVQGALQTLQTQKGADAGTIQFSRLGNGAGIRGQAAGGGFAYPWGVWASYERTDYEDEFAASAFDAERDGVLVGADFSPWDNFILGVALGYESTDIDTTFNRGTQEIEGYTVAPYLGALISDHVGVDYDLTFDMVLSYTTLDIDQDRVAGGARITSSTESDRWGFSGNFTAGKSFGGLYVSGRAGWLVARDDVDGFTESNGNRVADRDVQLAQLRAGGSAAYAFDSAWGTFEPFVNAIYENDFSRDDIVIAGGPRHPNDDDGVDFGAGLRFYGREGLTASFQYSTILGREDFDSDSYSFLVRWDF